ncbi:STAS/SEC14 domain-containing protein [Psychromonas sp. RZ22]|uniref:STAS/SEC14 domain-containing protein n=1 Tax=Psychromonas algarum TaxID=2555643 RepID=UPI0010678FE7|nr:STAS/SEC14 domain-containing protein [Psychromonas sp. RZ22]TEW56204.1 STAS/SEC14 domain-containing protein [Psychromonas sp. RZ22]
MIKQLEKSYGATIGLEISGTISAKEEQQWIEILDNIIEKNGNINVLIVLDGKVNFGIDVLYTDLKWTLKNIKNMNKLAIVSKSKVLGWLVAADSPFGKLVGVSEKHFALNKLSEAWDWVNDSNYIK